MTALATSGILFIGILKSLGIFDKLNAKIKKYVYFGLSCVTSIIACTIYLCATDSFDWKDWGITIACIIPYTLAIYGIYENTGLRRLLQKVLFAPVKNLVARLFELIKKGSFAKEEVKDIFETFVEDVVADIEEVLEDTNANTENLSDGNEINEQNYDDAKCDEAATNTDIAVSEQQCDEEEASVENDEKM